MKKIFLLLIAVSYYCNGIRTDHLQRNYMKKIPALPKDSCNVARAVVESFFSTGGRAFAARLQDQIGQLNDKRRGDYEQQ